MKKRQFIFIVVLSAIFFSIISPASVSSQSPVCEAVSGNCYYVSPAGNDANNGSFTAPWLTPQHAWYNANAGDYVYFREGTYDVSSTISTQDAGHDGTAANPIVFKNYDDEKATIIGDCGGGSIFQIERNYNFIYGLNFIGLGLNADRGIINLGYDTDTYGTRIENCTFNITSVADGDNSCAIHLKIRAANTTIRNNRIIGPGSSFAVAHSGNLAGIVAYNVDGFVAENNEISDWTRGIYFKFSNPLVDTNLSISKNYIYRCKEGIASVANYARIEDNILVGCPIRLGDNAASGSGGYGSDYNIIRHNTVYDSNLTMFYQDRNLCYGNLIEDNIIMITSEWHEYTVLDANTTSDYNLYPSGAIIKSNFSIYDLTGWRTYHSSDSHSLSGTPVFTGGIAPSNISGFALSSSSLGKNAASDGKDMGADTSIVGINAFSGGSLKMTLEELMVEINRWKRGEITIAQVINAMERWKSGA